MDTKEYDAKWPKACRKCSGKGEITYSYDPSPAGVSLSSGSMEDTEPCSACFEANHCPRCAEELVSAENFEWSKCPTCGWNWAGTDGDGAKESDGSALQSRPEEEETWELP